jgi:MoaA/NifB/PqqE/SkfB family radical SAM enzyme
VHRIQLENREPLAPAIPLSTPWVLFIDPSSYCNFKCKFCMNDKIKDKKTMDFNLYKKIIDDLQEFPQKIKVLRLYCCGEPLMNVYFTDMVKYAKKSDKVLKVDTTTNGFILNSVYNCDLIASGIDRINISINGMTSAQYRDFTGRNVNFSKLVSNIEHLYSIKKDTIIFVKINGDYLSEADKNLFMKTFSPISDGCNIEHTISCWYDTEVENIDPDVGVYGQPRESVLVCPYPQYSMTIQSDGQASVCFLDWDKRMIIGDARYQSVKNIWNGERMKAFQKDMLRGRRSEHIICSQCDQLSGGMPENLDSQVEEILKRLGNG